MNKRIERKQNIFFLNEQKRIQNIKSEDQYSNELDRWNKTKSILDGIYKLIPPFGEVQKISKKITNIFSVKEQVELFQRNRGIKIYLDPNKFSSEIQLFFKPALDFFFSMGSINYTNYEGNDIVTSRPYREFIKGHILIRNRSDFEKFYEKFIQFYDFINVDKIAKTSQQQEKLSANTGIIDLTPKMDIKQPTWAEISKASVKGTSETIKMNFEKEMQNKQFKNQRILNSKEDKKVHALNTIIERIEPYYHDQKNIIIDYHYFNYEDRKDDSRLLEKFLDTAKNRHCFTNFTRTNYSGGTKFSFTDINLDKIKKYRDELLKQQNKLDTKKEEKQKKEGDSPKDFEIKIIDRQIWINNYFLSKPQALGKNLEFFEYVRSRPKKTIIRRNELPNKNNWDLKTQITGTGFIKILNCLGFKGELLKAYFPKRGKNELIYRGDKITRKEIEKDGIKISILIKELELANEKNSSE